MIIDCFLFNDELKMLDFRLAELNDHVDCFVLVEARTTYLNEPKRLYFEENKARSAKYLHKIHHIVLDPIFKHVPLTKAECLMWQIYHQQQQVLGALHVSNDSQDTIFYGDLDEIWDVRKLPEILGGSFPVRLQGHWYVWDLEHRVFGPRLVSDYIVAVKPETVMQSMAIDVRGDRLNTRNKFRYIKNSSWHLSWFGGEEQIINKVVNGLGLDHFRIKRKEGQPVEATLDRYRKKRLPLMATGQPLNIEYIPIAENDFLPIHYKMLLDEHPV
jgi:hypothetical protein